MKIRIRFALLTALFVSYSSLLNAQYLTVKTKTAAILEVAETGGQVLEEVVKGTNLAILQEASASSGNFYKVTCTEDECEGWIVANAVKRIEGEMPTKTMKEYRMATHVFGTGQIPPGYYSSVAGLDGGQLKTQLHYIIRNHKTYTYDDVYSALEKTDQDPTDTMNVILLYTLRTVNKENKDRGGKFNYKKHKYTYQDAWNREHVWPKSFGFPNEKDTAYTDLHHLRPADRTMNTRRNNRSFDNGTEIFYDNGGSVPTECLTSDEWTWEPPDAVKGDIARMIFYMAVRYEGFKKNGKKIMDLEITEAVQSKSSKEPRMGRLSTLLEWHEQDPVDNWERRRNDIIYRYYQGNRNPFIDHPEFVEKIWPH